MIVEYIRYRVSEERTPGFEAAYRRAGSSLDASPHCQRYEVAGCTQEPGVYIVRIEWDSAEGHLAGFRRGSDFRSFFGAVGPFVENIEEMHHYDVKAASDTTLPPST